MSGFDLTVEVHSGDKCIPGRVRNLSPGGLQIELDGVIFKYFFKGRRVIFVEVRSNNQPVFQATLIVVYVEEKPDGSGLYIGLRYIRNAYATVPAMPVGDPDSLVPDRRAAPRCLCELPASFIVGSSEPEQTLPVVVTDISEQGCRVEGSADLEHLLPGTMGQICIEPFDMAPICVLAELVAIHSPRVLGLRFSVKRDSAQGEALKRLMLSLRYPDLVFGASRHAEGIWQTLSASGYFRERAPEAYQELRDQAVECWAKLNSVGGRAINRTLITPDPEDRILSVCQLSQFYTNTWMAHHLAVMGDKRDRLRLAPQQFGGVFDMLEQLGPRYFINYHNTVHKAQNGIWLSFEENVPAREISLRELLCYDIVCADDWLARSRCDTVLVRQVGNELADQILPVLRDVLPPLVYDAMCYEADFELERLDRAYRRVDLTRLRCWLLAQSGEGELLGMASMEVVPTGFNLTSIGDHVWLHLVQRDREDTDVMVRMLVQHAKEYFRRIGKPYFILMAEPEDRALLHRSLGIRPMAAARELIFTQRLFPLARDFIRKHYDGQAETRKRGMGGGRTA